MTGENSNKFTDSKELESESNFKDFLIRNGKVAGMWLFAGGIGLIAWGVGVGLTPHYDCGSFFVPNRSDTSNVFTDAFTNTYCKVTEYDIAAPKVWSLITIGIVLIIFAIVAFSFFKPSDVKVQITAVSNDDIAEKLKSIESLRQSGVLTEEEFNKAKKKILES